MVYFVILLNSFFYYKVRSRMKEYRKGSRIFETAVSLVLKSEITGVEGAGGSNNVQNSVSSYVLHF